MAPDEFWDGDVSFIVVNFIIYKIDQDQSLVQNAQNIHTLVNSCHVLPSKFRLIQINKSKALKIPMQ